MNDLRTAIILNLTGNVSSQSRRFGRDLENMSRRGSRAARAMNRGLALAGRGLDRLGNRYTALITGAAGIGAIRMVANLEARFTRLGIQANRSAEAMEKLKQQIFSVSQLPDIRIDPSQLTAAVEEIVEKTGDLDFATANLRNLAAAIQATGGQGLAIGGIAAEFQKMGLTNPRDVLTALDILTVQGKQGAFTLQNLAALGPRVVTAYTAMGRTGLPAIREMGAALQVIRQGTGSSEMAATAFEALMRTLGDADKIKLLRRGGIKVFDPKELAQGRQVLRPINELMVEIIERTKGRKTILSNVFDAEAMRAFNAAAAEYQRTGIVASLDRFYNVQADGSTLMADSTRAAGDFNAALTNLYTVWKKFADNQLSKPIKDLTDTLDGLKPGTVERWLNIAKWIGIIGGAAVAGRGVYRFGRGAYRVGRHIFGRSGAGGLAAAGAGAGIPALPGGVVPVYVVNSGFGGAGGAGKAGGKLLPMIGRAGTAAAGAYALHEYSLEPLGLGIRSFKRNWSGYTDAVQNIYDVFSGKRDWRTGRLVNAGDNQMSGKLEITFDHQNRPAVTRLEAQNMDIEVDTGRVMVGPR